MKMLKQVGV